MNRLSERERERGNERQREATCENTRYVLMIVILIHLSKKTRLFTQVSEQEKETSVQEHQRSERVRERGEGKCTRDELKKIVEASLMFI